MNPKYCSTDFLIVNTFNLLIVSEYVFVHPCILVPALFYPTPDASIKEKLTQVLLFTSAEVSKSLR